MVDEWKQVDIDFLERLYTIGGADVRYIAGELQRSEKSVRRMTERLKLKRSLDRIDYFCRNISLHKDELLYRAMIDDSCWNWQGCVNNGGYPKIGINGKPVYAHRWIFEYMVGTIPADMTIDHLCNNRKCVNPMHMEVVTNLENTKRGVKRRQNETPAS